MPRACTVCQHPNRAEIDDLLVRAESNRRIAAQFAVTEQAIRRHKAAHLPATLVQAQEAKEVARGDDLLGQVRELQAKALGILEKAEVSGDLKAAVSAIREARGCVELLAKLTDQLRDGATLNLILTSPHWVEIRDAVSRALSGFPEARVEVVQALRSISGGVQS
jgi:hypothetical protein